MTMQAHLEKILPGRPRSLTPPDPRVPLSERLARCGLTNVLAVNIHRKVWVVQDQLTTTASPKKSDTVAKIKYDRVVASRGSSRREFSEIELTGVEDHRHSPTEFRRDQFGIFLSSFVTVCGDRLGRPNITARGDAKYFYALRLHGILATDGPSVGAASLVRAKLAEPSEPQRRVYQVLTPYLLVAAGLAGIPYSGMTAGWQAVTLAVVAFVLVIVGIAWICLSASSPLPRSIRASTVVITAVLIAVALVGRDNLGVAADILSILGFPLGVAGVLGVDLLRRAARRRPDPS